MKISLASALCLFSLRIASPAARKDIYPVTVIPPSGSRAGPPT